MDFIIKYQPIKNTKCAYFYAQYLFLENSLGISFQFLPKVAVGHNINKKEKFNFLIFLKQYTNTYL